MRRANGVRYGLAASVWTENHGRAMRMSTRLGFGVNCHIPIAAEMPHGGIKHMGYSKDLSLHGLEDYTRVKRAMSYIERRAGGRADTHVMRAVRGLAGCCWASRRSRGLAGTRPGGRRGWRDRGRASCVTARASSIA
ncbi:MAG: betaine-aldehyde dehydrogenase [Solirubrobacteraceae bacterium]